MTEQELQTRVQFDFCIASNDMSELRIDIHNLDGTFGVGYLFCTDWHRFRDPKDGHWITKVYDNYDREHVLHKFSGYNLEYHEVVGKETYRWYEVLYRIREQATKNELFSGTVGFVRECVKE